jgi:hypothetical protein
MCGPRSVLLILGGSALALAFVLLVTSIPLKSWYTYTYGTYFGGRLWTSNAHVGLWKYCRDDHVCDSFDVGTIRCWDGRGVAARWNAVRGLAVAAPVCAFLGLSCCR